MSSDNVSLIKERLSIADVIGGYVKLERAGSTLRARCPFHNEKTPSFHVSPERGSFKCFGCGKGGDIFTFIQEIEGIEFRDALKLLADRAGIELVHENPEERNERDRLFQILKESEQFYADKLKKVTLAQSYLEGRGVTQNSIEKFRIGFAPNDWRELYSHLREKRYTDTELVNSGMIVRLEKPGQGARYIDRFRSRIMFPIENPSGQTVGFSGRIFGSVKNADGSEPAKYINSPQTAIYDKSRLLFGYSMAKNKMRTENKCIFVEGQMDLIMSHQAGVENTVAVSGTALTADQISLVKRLTDNIVFAFDSDDAGLKAAYRSVEPALAAGMEVSLLAVQGGKDPADLILQDPNEWIRTIQMSEPAITFFARTYKQKYGENQRELQRAVSSMIIPLLTKLESGITRAHFTRQVAVAIGLPESSVAEDVAKQLSGMPAEVRDNKPVSKHDRNSELFDRIAGLFAVAESRKYDSFKVADKIARLRELDAEIVKRLDELPEPDKIIYIKKCEDAISDEGIAQKMWEEIECNIEMLKIKEELDALQDTIRNAEREGNGERVDELLRVWHDKSSAHQKLKQKLHEKEN